MADDFRRMLDRKTGKGGVHCCCNDYHGKERKVLRRMVRSVLKQKHRNEIKHADLLFSE